MTWPTLYTLDEHGEPVPCEDTLTWAKWFETSDRQLAMDAIGDLQISTVFLGLDHSFSGDGPPVLWETMILGGRSGWLEPRTWRYTSRADAPMGHAEIVRQAKAQAWPKDTGNG